MPVHPMLTGDKNVTLPVTPLSPVLVTFLTATGDATVTQTVSNRQFLNRKPKASCPTRAARKLTLAPSPVLLMSAFEAAQ